VYSQSNNCLTGTCSNLNNFECEVVNGKRCAIVGGLRWENECKGLDCGGCERKDGCILWTENWCVVDEWVKWSMRTGTVQWVGVFLGKGRRERWVWVWVWNKEC
jgi:hypothetical protein